MQHEKSLVMYSILPRSPGYCGIRTMKEREITGETSVERNDKVAQGNETKSKAMMHRNLVELERDLRGVFDRKHSRGVMLCPSWVSSSAPAPADG